MKKKILGAVFLALAVICVASAASQGGKNALLGGFAVGAVFAVLGVRDLKSAAPAKKPMPAAGVHTTTARPAPAAPQYHFVNFRVAGVTFDNDDGTNRQSIIADIDHQRSPFQDGDNLNVAILRSSWQGELAFEVRVNDVLIGHVPKDSIAEVDEALRHSDAMVSGFKIDGGTNGYNYGVGIAIRYQ